MKMEKKTVGGGVVFFLFFFGGGGSCWGVRVDVNEELKFL